MRADVRIAREMSEQQVGCEEQRKQRDEAQREERESAGEQRAQPEAAQAEEGAEQETCAGGTQHTHEL